MTSVRLGFRFDLRELIAIEDIMKELIELAMIKLEEL